MRQTLGDICTAAVMDGNPKVTVAQLADTVERLRALPDPTDVFVEGVLAYAKQQLGKAYDPDRSYVVVSAVGLPSFIRLDREKHRVFSSPILPKGMMYMIKEPICGGRL